MVVHAEDGLDELSLAAATQVAELKDGELREYRLQPQDLGVDAVALDDLAVTSPAESAQLIRDALSATGGARAAKAAEMVAINAGAACYVAGLCDSVAQGVELARDLIATGQAREKIDALAAFCDCLDD